MAEHGGYRRPENPAQFSGPGAHSQRTDGKPGETPTQAARYISGMPNYGDAADINSVAQAAPLAAAPASEGVIPFSAPTQREDEPVTAGANFGEGDDATSLARVGAFNDNEEPDVVAAVVRAAYAAYPSPYLRVLVEDLDSKGRP